MKLIDRFFSYVRQDTQSDPETDLVPSTPAQMAFAKVLAEELKSIGLSEVELDNNGYIMATLPSNIDEDRPVVGFIAHMDTSPDMSGKNVEPQIIKSYNGGDILLDPDDYVVLSPAEFPELLFYKGQDLICTNGKTLLGADDKAGIAEIVSAMEYLIAHPEIKHGKIRVGFTPDEEIGKGPDHFDVEKFGADWAYTIDGGEIGELEYENFNAASAKITFKGRNVHPGYAKHKMMNSIRIAHQFAAMLPRHETPEHTEQ
jgi:tripeptide aminopeptidase